MSGGGKTRGDSETDHGIKGMKKKYARKEKQVYEIEATLLQSGRSDLGEVGVQELPLAGF